MCLWKRGDHYLPMYQRFPFMRSKFYLKQSKCNITIYKFNEAIFSDYFNCRVWASDTKNFYNQLKLKT